MKNISFLLVGVFVGMTTVCMGQKKIVVEQPETIRSSYTPPSLPDAPKPATPPTVVPPSTYTVEATIVAPKPSTPPAVVPPVYTPTATIVAPKPPATPAVVSAPPAGVVPKATTIVPAKPAGCSKLPNVPNGGIYVVPLPEEKGNARQGTTPPATHKQE